MIFRNRRKSTSEARLEELNDKLEKLREDDIPVHFDPRELHEKIAKRHEENMSIKRFQTRKIFIFTVFIIGIMYGLVLITQRQMEENFTNIKDLPQIVNTIYNWKPVVGSSDFRLIISLEIKPDSKEKLVRLNDNAVFDLTLRDADGKELYNQKFALGEKLLIDETRPLVLQTELITTRVKDKVVAVEFATETHLTKQKN